MSQLFTTNKNVSIHAREDKTVLTYSDTAETRTGERNGQLSLTVTPGDEGRAVLSKIEWADTVSEVSGNSTSFTATWVNNHPGKIKTSEFTTTVDPNTGITIGRVTDHKEAVSLSFPIDPRAVLQATKLTNAHDTVAFLKLYLSKEFRLNG